MNEADRRRAKITRYLPALMLITDSSHLQGRLMTDVARRALDGGVNMVQVREKAMTDEGLCNLSAQLREATTGSAMLFVNGNIQAAVLSAAEVHLAEDTMHPDEARKGYPASMVVSQSVHSLEAAERAEADGADMLVLGTVFPSQSHPGGPTIGLDGVREVCKRVRTPVIGIGGITAQNAGDVIRAGASGVAVISAIFDAPEPRAAAADLRAAIDAAWAERVM